MRKRRFGSSFDLFLLLFLITGVLPFHSARAQTSTTEPDDPLPSFKFGGFLQQQFIADQTPDSPTRFSIHRARLGVTGSITDRIRINLVGGYVEPPDRTPRLVNAFIDFDIHPLFQLRTGQFLLPFGLEGPQPIFLNPAIERTTAIRRLNTFTMFRDIGVQVSGDHSIVNYAVALVNGEGANNPEQFEPKDIMGRIGFTPIEDIEVGISGHLGQYRPNPSTADHETRKRAGVDVSYKGEPFFARGEYITRQDNLSNGRNLKMNGLYLLGGFKIMADLEAIARYERYIQEDAFNDEEFTALTIGASYYFIANTRVSANYEFRDDSLNPDLGNLFTIQIQVAL